jgi:hypothetical protein
MMPSGRPMILQVVLMMFSGRPMIPSGGAMILHRMMNNSRFCFSGLAQGFSPANNPAN